jgi:hypothetical protein
MNRPSDIKLRHPKFAPIEFWLRRYPDLDVRWLEFPFALMNGQNACSSMTSIGKAFVHTPTVQIRSAGEGPVQREAACSAKAGLP